MKTRKINFWIRLVVNIFVTTWCVSGSAKTIQNISLSVGINHDQSVPSLPENFEPTGTYKSLIQLQYNSETKMLRIVPKKEGFGTLTLQDKKTGQPIYEFTIDVKRTDLNKVMREITALLGEVEGIQIKIYNNKVAVDGQILLPADMKRIHSVVKQYGDLATSFVTLSPAAQVKIAQFIERAIGNPEIQVQAVNGKFMLSGIAESKEEKDRAEIIAKTYVPDVVIDEAVADKKVQERVTDIVINLINIRAPPEAEPSKLVQIVVHYVELQKDYEKGFRFQWTPELGDGSKIQFSGGDRGPAGLASTITGTISNLLPKLNWAKSHGHARILQSSSIIVENSKTGIINSIQNVPYQVVTGDGVPSTAFTEAGLRTNVTPNIVGSKSDSVGLKLSFSVKSLLGMTAQGPLTSSREINTEVVVRSGQSAAIGGLISSDSGTDYNKLPAGTGTNPLFSLYASKSFRKNQSQFVVFVTPLIKASASSGTEEIKRKFRLRD